MINDKHIPHVYKCNSRQVRLQVLAGLIDSDGHYSSKDKCFTIIQKSNQLTDDILYIARSLGFAAYCKKVTKSWSYKGVKKQGIYNRVIISGDGLHEVPTKVPRKRAEKRLQKKNALLTGINVKPVGKGNYYGFTLDGNNRYLLGDFTVTHNTCTAIAAATTSFEQQGYTILWVTRTTLKSDIWKNMFDQVCHMNLVRRVKEDGLVIPDASDERMRLLSNAWSIRPMSYKQFSNLVAGNNSLYQSLVKKNGKQDPLRKTLLIIDEAHKLYGGTDLSSVERPDMNKLHAAIMKSYAISGKDSVRLMLMTATPFTNDPMELIKLINLCRNSSEQMPSNYDAFSTKYSLNPDGTFSKRGSRVYLDDVAGHISYLNRERDARQFAQPVITPVMVPLSRSPDGASSIDNVKEQLKEALATIKEFMTGIKNSIKEEKKQLTSDKKTAKERCKSLKGKEKKECLEEVETEISLLEQEHIDRKAELEKELLAKKLETSKLRKETQEQLKKAKDDQSQMGVISAKCVAAAKKPKKPATKKRQQDNSDDESVDGSQVVIPQTR
jgi:hypothetical protein